MKGFTVMHHDKHEYAAMIRAYFGL